MNPTSNQAPPSAPKKPIAVTSGGYAACPCCGQLIYNPDRKPITHCGWCRQTIDWRN